MRAALLCLLLTGCCAVPVVERVEVPMPVYCEIEIPEPPAWATETLGAAAPLWELVRAMLAERVQRAAYERELIAAIEGCRGPAR